MACNVVALCAGCRAVLPLAGEAEVVGALSANVVVAEVVIEGICIRESLCAGVPLAGERGAVVVLDGVGHVGGGLEQGVLEGAERDE